MTEGMEDTNSWNEMIFRNIRARRDWFSALLRRNRLEHKDDTAHKEAEDLEVKKKMYLDQENPLFIKWCRGRMDKEPPGEVDFDILLQEKKGSSEEEQETMDKEPLGEVNFGILLQEKKGSSGEEQEKMDKEPLGKVNFGILLQEEKGSSGENRKR